MPSTVNAQIADALTARLLQVGRVTTGLRLDVWRQLAVLESDLLAVLKMADPTDVELLRARRRAIEDLMEQDLEPLIARRYGGLAAFSRLHCCAWPGSTQRGCRHRSMPLRVTRRCRRCPQMPPSAVQ